MKATYQWMSRREGDCFMTKEIDPFFKHGGLNFKENSSGGEEGGREGVR